jgi:hypothetical protein
VVLLLLVVLLMLVVVGRVDETPYTKHTHTHIYTHNFK